MIISERNLRLAVRTALVEKKRPKPKVNIWDAIRAKRKRGEPPAEPGDEGYPDERTWKSATGEGQERKPALSERLDEAMAYHCDHGVGVDANIFRPGSTAFFALFREARARYTDGKYALQNAYELELLEDLDIGEFAVYGGQLVPLDYPILCGSEEHLNEAEYNGRKVELNKPKRGEKGRAYVYVNSGKKNKDGTIKVKKVEFGSSMPDAFGDSEEHRKRRKNFGSRHNCAEKKDKTKPGYWSCRATKFFGRNMAGWW